MAEYGEFLLPISGRHAQIIKTFKAVEMIAPRENRVLRFGQAYSAILVRLGQIRWLNLILLSLQDLQSCLVLFLGPGDDDSPRLR